MTSIELIAIQTLREKGYAVAVWPPDELGIADPRALEDQAVNTYPWGLPYSPSPMEIEIAGDGTANWVHLLFAAIFFLKSVPHTFIF